MSDGVRYSDYVKKLPHILSDTGITEISSKAHTQYIESTLISPSSPVTTKVSGNLSLISSSLDSFACDLYIHSYFDEAKKLFEDSFLCRRDHLSKIGENIDLNQLFYLCVSALGTKRLSELRLILKEHDIPEKPSEETWYSLVMFHITRSFLLLCRKSKGWEDIIQSTKSIERLRALQKEFEDKYLQGIKESDIIQKASSIGRLISLYNLAKVIEITGTYLLKADPPNPELKIKKHYDNAIEALRRSGADTIELFVDMVFVGCDSLIKNSIWYNTGTLGQKIREFVTELANEGKKDPFIELWPSQQDTMKGSLFDTAKRSIILQMPTSGGKTLMAMFSIVQSYALNPSSVIVYVVPTRALVNQITLQMRRNLAPLGIVTESAVPVFELDPIENELLKKDCNVLVSTPEKLELLLRTKHKIVEDISLVVVDEVHNISDKNRGSTLELFLGKVSREKPNARFLMMSPFIPNAEDIGSWLSKGASNNASIKVNWKPSERITACAHYIGKKPKKSIELILIPSAHNSDVKEEVSIPLKSKVIEDGNTKTNVALSSALSLVDKGGVLILCSGRESAVKRAKTLLDYSSEIKLNELLEITMKYLKDELGDNHVLPKMIKKGVAFHHAGLSLEARYLIERLVETGDIKIICATTTLAQGVNFPIKTVIVESTQRKIWDNGWRWENIAYNEFWNIAGRAGRAMQDHIGLIIFASRNKEDDEVYKTYLKNEAKSIVSSILSDLNNLKDINEKLDRKFVASYPALAKFFQYLLHTVTVSDYDSVSSDMEEILRSSLIYHQSEKDSPESAAKLIQIARSYLELIKGKSENKGLLQLIDGTGFSSMTIDFLWTQKKEFSDADLWKKESLFSEESNTLKEMIDTLAEVPELDLSRLGKGKLDTDTIAKIIKEWVSGKSVEYIADNYFSKSSEDRDERILNASRYVHNVLVGQLAWGMSALLKVSLFGKEDINREEINHIPAMMFYGVTSKESVTLRMVGVPRNNINILSKRYSKHFKEKSPTFQEIRNWLSSTKSDEWVDKSKSRLSGKEAKKIWSIMNGLE